MHCPVERLLAKLSVPLGNPGDLEYLLLHTHNTVDSPRNQAVQQIPNRYI